MIVGLFLFIGLFCNLSVNYVNGWGIEGHALVVHLAERQLTTNASEWVKSILPWFLSGNLTAAASWADDIIHDNSNHFDYLNWQWSRPLHYIDLPDWICNYDPDRDCKNDVCVDGALRNYSQRVIAIDLDHQQHQDALMFLIHFAGDVHQPLHVSFEGDLGGNKVKGHFMNNSRETNLHSLWDTGLIQARLTRDFKSNLTMYFEYLYDRMLNETSSVNDGGFREWIDESIRWVCEQVYLDEKNITMNASNSFQLGNIYYTRNIPVIEKRIIQGGRRLGNLLNMLATNRTTPSLSSTTTTTKTKTTITTTFTSTKSLSTSSERLHWSTIALIVILSIEVVIGVALLAYRRYTIRQKTPTIVSFSSGFKK